MRGICYGVHLQVTIVDTPGIIDGRRFKDFPLDDVFQASVHNVVYTMKFSLNEKRNANVIRFQFGIVFFFI